MKDYTKEVIQKLKRVKSLLSNLDELAVLSWNQENQLEPDKVAKYLNDIDDRLEWLANATGVEKVRGKWRERR